MSMEKVEMQIQDAKLSMDSLAIYRNILMDNVLKEYYELLDLLYYNKGDLSLFLSKYSSLCSSLMESGCGMSIRQYIQKLIIYDDNVFAREAAAGAAASLHKYTVTAASNDLACLEEAASLSSETIKLAAKGQYKSIKGADRRIGLLPDWIGISDENTDFIFKGQWDECVGELAEFYRQNGSGIFARFRSFVWGAQNKDNNNALIGISDNDPVRFTDLIGYEEERKVVIENTLHFLKGFNANNMLLYGDRGTGKSSTVKAVLNEYAPLGLRMIEVPKSSLQDFPIIVGLIKNRPQKFILFVDDLAFEDSEESYTALKAILEGGLECKPSNVVIYATSNRRHIVKEKFSDRSGFSSGNPDDEVRSADSMQEKLSLADRFGITVTFSSPDKASFLRIVEGLARARGIDAVPAELEKEALKWELWQNGRSPRTARQFIDWYEAIIKGK